MNDRLQADIGQIFEQLACSQPAAPALHVPGRTSLTYADLAKQIHYLRKRLSEWGFARGDVIAGMIPSRAEMAVACAALPAASTFAPLSPAFSEDVYAELLTRLRAKAVIVPAELEHPVRAAAQRCGVAEIALIANVTGLAGVFTLDLVRRGELMHDAARVSANFAYIVSSSGTTGAKKLAPLGHRQLIHYSHSLCDWLQLTADDIGCHLQPLHLGGGLRAPLLAPLLGGVPVVCLPEADVNAFFAALDDYRLTWLTAGFTVCREILDRAREHRDTIARSRLRFVRAGSGRLEPEEIDAIERLFGAPLLVALTSTESSAITLNPLPPRERRRGSVGLPMVNEVRVRADDGRFCAAGEVGEIVVRGPLVFDGYLDDPELNKVSFADGWLRTGDLGWFDADGYFFLSARAKDIINRGGEKISPVEIDAAIQSLDGVRAAAAFAIPHPTLGEELVAAVVRKPGANIAESDVIERVRQKVSAARVPRYIWFIDELPRTDNGKIRRPELARRFSADAPLTGRERLSAPLARSATEAALCGLWSAVLDGRIVGSSDDFFLAGGDSLRGVRLLTSVKAVFGVELPIASLFADGATIAGMARAIERARDAASHRHPPHDRPIEPRRTQGPAVLSGAQKRMWFLAALDPLSPHYNESRAYRLVGNVDTDALRRAVRLIARRHAVLRTTYSLIDGEPRQIVHDGMDIEVQCVDSRDIAAFEGTSAVDRLLLAEGERLFDLTRDPPLRVILVRVNDCEHVLLAVAHHIATDRWSRAIWERELSECYNAFKARRESPLPALPIQYADYAEWQAEWLRGPLVKEQIGYWKAKLADVAPLALPTDRPRPPSMNFRGARAAFDLPQSLSAALMDLSRREGATLFMTLLAAFQVLLHRYSGQDDIAVGAPMAGRNRGELESLVGFFANTLVLRVDLSGDPSFRELLARVRETALAAYAHSDLPFEKLIEELAPVRDLSRNPLFQVMFALRNTPEAALALEGVEVSPYALTTGAAKFDLMLALHDAPDGLHATWDYSTDLFDAETIERMARHFARLLEAIAANADQRIGALPLLGESERSRLLVEWNDTARDYPADRCIHDLFEEQAARNPDAVAIVCGENRLTYAELDARADRVAQHLMAAGVKADALVGICVERSLDLVVGLLGILKAGGAYVPLEPAWPQARLAFVLNDTRAAVVLTQKALVDRFPGYGGMLVCLDRDPLRVAVEVDRPSARVTARSLAYVMYTSGSTGTPKGVLAEHRGVVRLVKGTDYASLSAEDTLVHLAPLSFDASTFELWGALLNGGRVVLMPPGQPTLAEIGEAIRQHGVSTLWLTTGLFHLMVDERLEDLQPLRQLLTGGDVLSVEHVRKAKRALRGCRLVAAYGPTENTTFTSSFTVDDASDPGSGVPIGRPIANTRVYVLDEHREPVPVGVAGELYAGGDGVARGYLNDPLLTAAKFVPDPFCGRREATMYRTGDRVRYRSDGNLDFIGRLDHQVKVRGFRIEPAEVEAVLTAHPSVRQAVVVARKDASGDKRLVAYLLPAAGMQADPEALGIFVSERLPEYMRPTSYVTLDALPLLSSGKIDRRALALREVGEAAPASASSSVPCDDVERTLCRIWAELLGVEVVPDDDFFELGGHSLMAARLFARLDRTFGRALPLATLFKAPTVRKLARYYREGIGQSGSSALVAISVAGNLPPIFGLPGVSGNVLCFADIARELGAAQPFYGLQTIGLDGTCEPIDTIEVMAARYLAEVRRVQTRGPYHLIGACFGATVAFEMARQLLDAGEDVAFLGLIEPSSLGGALSGGPRIPIPPVLKRGFALAGFVADRLRLYRDEMRGLPLGARLKFVRGKLGIVGETLQKRDVFRGDRREFDQRRVNDANVTALLRYKHAPLPGAVAIEIFTSGRRATDPFDHGRVDWHRITRGAARYHRVPGKDSGDMLQGANASALAAVLSSRLHHARAGARAFSAL